MLSPIFLISFTVHAIVLTVARNMSSFALTTVSFVSVCYAYSISDEQIFLLLKARGSYLPLASYDRLTFITGLTCVALVIWMADWSLRPLRYVTLAQPRYSMPRWTMSFQIMLPILLPTLVLTLGRRGIVGSLVEAMPLLTFLSLQYVLFTHRYKALFIIASLTTLIVGVFFQMRMVVLLELIILFFFSFSGRRIDKVMILLGIIILSIGFILLGFTRFVYAMGELNGILWFIDYVLRFDNLTDRIFLNNFAGSVASAMLYTDVIPKSNIIDQIALSLRTLIPIPSRFLGHGFTSIDFVQNGSIPGGGGLIATLISFGYSGGIIFLGYLYMWLRAARPSQHKDWFIKDVILTAVAFRLIVYGPAILSTWGLYVLIIYLMVVRRPIQHPTSDLKPNKVPN